MQRPVDLDRWQMWSILRAAVHDKRTGITVDVFTNLEATLPLPLYCERVSE
jgi:hypothetical protein